MKLARLFFKPKWQHRDAAIRRDAVAGSHEPELISALPELCRSDLDAGVRMAALRRYNQYEAWRERSTADADPAVRQLARASYMSLLIGSRDGVPALERRIAELDTLANDELERVAGKAVDRDLRGAAMQRVNRPSLLVEWACSDSDAKLRAAALARISDADTLLRIAERCRKTDKTISREARERAEALRIAAGDSATIQARAKLLCERIEALLPLARSERATPLAEIETMWAEIADNAQPTWRDRFNSTRSFLQSDTDAAADLRHSLRGLRSQLQSALEHPELDMHDADRIVIDARSVLDSSDADLPERDRVEDLLVQLARRIAAGAPADNAAAAPQNESAVVVDPAVALAAQARFDAALATAQAEAARKRERERSLREELDGRVIELEQSLESGDLSLAQVSNSRIQALLTDLPVTARHDKRLVNSLARLAEFRRWQRWSNGERRKQLCEAIEALAGSGLHPDAVAHRVREARQEWLALDQAEGDSGGETVRGRQTMARRFQGLCSEALKPTQEYFSKRDEIRKSHQEEIEAILGELEALAADSDDWPLLARHRRTAGETLRKLDGVEPRAATQLARRLKQQMARIDALLDAHSAQVEASKLGLIERAQALSSAADPIAAAREVRDLQARWKSAGNGRRKTDDAQWKLFRSHCDAIFGRLDTQRQEREQRDLAARDASQALVVELETLAVAVHSDTTPALRRQLAERWAAASGRDRELDTRWTQAIERIDQAQRESERVRRQAVFSDALQRLKMCEDLEQSRRESNDVSAEWEACAAVPGELGSTLDLRYLRASSPTGAVSADFDIEAASDLLVLVEFLAGIPTPDHDRQRRMDLQVQRLAQRLGGDTTPVPREELLDLLHRWIALGQLPTATAPQLSSRFEQAFNAALQGID